MIKLELDGDPVEELAKEIKKLEDKLQTMLEVAGEVYVTTARQAGSRQEGFYQDISSNLRHANSYVVKKDGVLVKESIGMPQTASLIKEEPTGDGFALVAGNGMEYASFVEGKGYDVVSRGQLATERFVEEELRKLDEEKP